MNMDKKSYARYVEARAPRSPILKNCVHAFLVGGGICLAAEGMNQLFMWWLGVERADAGTLTAVILVFLAALFTAIGIFDRIAKWAGGGTLVPITGFANAVVSPAIDFKSEGFITGMAAKMFTIAGPVIVYGVSASVIYGFIYWLTTIF